MTPELRRRHREGKRRLRRQLLEERARKERRRDEIAIERQWAKVYGMRLQAEETVGDPAGDSEAPA